LLKESSLRILVVGGAGYIGSHVAQALLQRGHEVVAFDNLSSGHRFNVQGKCVFRHGDILLPETLDAVCQEFSFDGLVHLAALKAAGESMLLPEKYSRHNISGSLNLIHAAVKYQIRHFLFSSSAAVYGEPAYLPIDEKHPTRPENYYGYTKLAIEQYLDWYSRLKGLKFIALRYFNAAGYDPTGGISGLEKSPANLLPVVMETAMGWRPTMQVFGTDYPTRDGTGVRDYIHVADLAVAHAQALEHLEAHGQNLIINLGSEMGLTVLEILKKTKEIIGRDIPHQLVARRPGDTASVLASAKFAQEVLGWKAMHSDVETLVRTTWNAYQKHAAAGGTKP
jgi:UDP-glucose 4-epimerase